MAGRVVRVEGDHRRHLAALPAPLLVGPGHGAGLSRTSALRMHTYGTARQLRMDGETGTIRAGRAADLLLLDRDVTERPVADISDTTVRLTLVGGRVVHDAESASGRTASAGPARSMSAPRPSMYAAVHGGRHRACGCAAH
ncbi:amidohydrolase family protein [Streptomyces sp. NBC_00572]|uniref:amidohydrolase family protein n=1 Tax=Streptomyces sp. NBC_00572 TaxID=2903664 RepID=UPI002257E703|nr:amidohydrolase family protein [Streptomyces sp. NBC_00572]MCX4984131.1 amidohydrolase family protein [Streptomyces sp. NBC_00572]